MPTNSIAFVALLGLTLSLAVAGESDQIAIVAAGASMLLLAALAFLFMRDSHDLFHPMSLLLGAWLLRTGCPAVLLMSGESPQMPLFITGWAEQRFWVPGFNLGAAGCFSLALTFFCIPVSKGRSPSSFRSATDRQAVRHSAIAVTIIGTVLVVYYLLTNFGSVGGVVSALNSGTLRSSDEFARSGTSRYSFLGKQCLLWGSVLWGLSEYRKRRSVSRTVAAPLVAFILILPFGGRIVAIAPVAIVVLVWWYDKGRIEGFSRVPISRLMRWIILLMTCMIAFIYIGMLTRAYRSGGGVQALKQQFSERSLKEELTWSIWNEAGFLHPLGYAIKFGPGTIDPSIGRLIFGGYSAHLLGYDTEALPGELIVTKLMGVGGWGIHTGAVVDLFLWKGMPAVLTGCVIAGVLLKFAYIRLARAGTGPTAVAVYGYFFWTFFWAIFENVIGYPTTMLEGTAALIAILIVANTISIFARQDFPPPAPWAAQ